MAAYGWKPELQVGARLKRDDGRVLLVLSAATGGRWSIPTGPMWADEVAEDAVTRLVRDRLHMAPGSLEFAETLTMYDSYARTVLVNVFDCTGWSGEPRYSEEDFFDVAWARPDGLESIAVVSEVREWLEAEAAERTPAYATEEGLAAALTEARRELLAAFEALPPEAHDRPLDGDTTPVDVLVRAAAAEAYHFEESRRLIGVPGHAWRPFNEDQWTVSARAFARPTSEEALARLEAGQAETLNGLQWLSPSQLTYYVNHPERGIARVGECILTIARDDMAAAELLRKMARSLPAPDVDEADAGLDEPARDFDAATTLSSEG